MAIPSADSDLSPGETPIERSSKNLGSREGEWVQGK
jgi:hypothetical protein